MAKIRITKEFRFEMAHALGNYDGKCSHIHGHSYILYVTIIGSPITDENNPKLGMVIDFVELKNIVNTHIVNPLDHALIMRKGSKHIENLQADYGNVVLVDYQPTCENMIAKFAETLMKKLPANVKLHHLRLHETATSYAEWYAEDN